MAKLGFAFDATQTKTPRKREAIPQGVRFDVFRRDNFACVYCGRSSPDVTLHCDHVQAHSKGGSNDKSNLVTACDDCNYGKGAKTVRYNRTGRVTATQGGVVGIFGHRLDENGDIKNQFEIIGEVGSLMATIQLFSFSDGSPTTVEIISISDLSTQAYRLYASAHAFRYAYWVEKERLGQLRGKTADQAFAMSEMVRKAA